MSLPHLGNKDATKEDFSSCIEAKSIISAWSFKGGSPRTASSKHKVALRGTDPVPLPIHKKVTDHC